MRSKGLIPEGCVFAGHSLGEYAALASIGDILPVETLVDIVFYRGMTMQCAVSRKADGSSDYGMMAVNPIRVGKGFGETALSYVCNTIQTMSRGLLEIVNYNVENWQYVVAGNLSNLETLTTVLNHLHKEKMNVQKLLELHSLEHVQEQLRKIVDHVLQTVCAQYELNGKIILSKGIATIPLPGIDVPFHSRFLLSGVAPFRQYLCQRLRVSHINVNLLNARYIPNLTAVPFNISVEYFQLVHDMTQSAKLKSVLKTIADVDTSQLSLQEQHNLGYILLIEILAFQFASPVQWIKTQDQLFGKYCIERLIEIGPSAVLSGMAKRTLNFKYSEVDEATNQIRHVFCFGKDQQSIYYELERNFSKTSPNPVAETSASAKVSPPAAVPVPILPPSPSPPVIVSDSPVSCLEVLHSIVAVKLSKPLSEISVEKSI
eukprot:Sdes_comp15268_c0_seq1m4111